MNRINKILLGIVFMNLAQIQLTECINCFPCVRDRKTSSQIELQPVEPLLDLVCKIHDCVRRRINQGEQLPFRYNMHELRERVYHCSNDFTSMYQRYAAEMHDDEDAPLKALFKALETKIADYAKRSGKQEIIGYRAIQFEAVPFVYYLSKNLKEDEPKPNNKKPGTEYDREKVKDYINRFLQVMDYRNELGRMRVEAEKEVDSEVAHASDSKKEAKGKNKSTETKTSKAEGSSSASQRLASKFIINLATEFHPVHIDVLNHFIKLANKQFKKVPPRNMVEFWLGKNERTVETGEVLPRPIDEDDIQILYSGPQERPMDMLGHTVCGFYNQTDRKLHIYNSGLTLHLSDNQKNLVGKLYPHIAKEQPIFERLGDDMVQHDEYSCALYTMAYATSFLLGHTPTDIPFKLNDAVGDSCLFLRLHLLRIFKEQNITLFPNST